MNSQNYLKYSENLNAVPPDDAANLKFMSITNIPTLCKHKLK